MPSLLEPLLVGGGPLAGLRVRGTTPGPAGPPDLHWPVGAAILSGHRGAEILVVVVRATFPLIAGQERVPEEPLALCDRYEDDVLVDPSDFALARTGTSILAQGHCAHPTPVESFPVSLQVGNVGATWQACGPTTLRRGPGGEPLMGAVAPVTSVPLRHALAFGGPSFAHNPAGRGALVPEGGGSFPAPQLLARLPASSEPLDERALACLPLPVSPAWAPRAPRAGTMDAGWIAHTAPSAPDDMSDAFGDVAPDAWVHKPWLRGGEAVSFRGLGPLGSGTMIFPGLHLRLSGPFRRQFQLRFARVTFACR